MAILLISKVRFARETLCARLAAGGHRSVEAMDFTGAPWTQLEQPPRVLFVIAEPGEGIRLVSEFRAVHPTTRVGVLAIGDGDEEFVAWARLGISGYVEADTGMDGIVATIDRLANGEIVYPTRLSGLLLRQFACRETDAPRESGLDMLTQREQDVIELLADGKANKQIARRLAITHSTVKNHVHNILEKLNASSRGEAAALYRRRAPGASLVGFSLARFVGPGPQDRRGHPLPFTPSLSSAEAD